MKSRFDILKLMKEVLRGCLLLINRLRITNDYYDSDLREIRRNVTNAMRATENSLHTYKNRKE